MRPCDKAAASMPPKRKQRDDDDDDDLQRLNDDADDDELEDRLERRKQENSKLGERYDEFLRCATDEQLERFEHYKRSRFPRAAMRKLMTEVLGNSSERGAVVLASVAKMFVGEMVEISREQMTAAGEEGAIQPHHLRQAYRKMRERGVVPTSSRHQHRMFWRADAGS